MPAQIQQRSALARLRLAVRGAVQGVGFRPFIYRLATEMGLRGWITNSAQGVFLEVEGSREELETFLRRTQSEKPPISFIQSLEPAYLDPVGYPTFEIRPSLEGEKTAVVLPDFATCADCRREILDPTDRRYHYPFTNCTNCGPRFSIIAELPYDRPRTSMRKFQMCPQCAAEYKDPGNRRFHAQPNACPVCGPRLEFWAADGRVVASRDAALISAADGIRRGMVVAVKGLGGFHLMVDAQNTAAIRELRQRKHREEKPFALMYPSLEMVKRHCVVSELEERLLNSVESPIVLLRRQISGAWVEAVAPRNPYLGVMLPYTPLHILLMNELDIPVVATSGNLSDEPICTDEHEALERLRGIADVFLVHDRPIVRHVDDSIVREMGGREMMLRRARGYAPLPVFLKEELPPLLAVGAHQKNTIAAAVHNQVFLSQHIGDLETEQAVSAFREVIDSFKNMYELQPQALACDQHPDYVSTQYAHQAGTRVIPVQHHYAHALACMAENEVPAPCLAVTWDGSGYGPDGTVWGGEFLRITEDGFARVAHFRTFPLPGGEKAVKEPRRVAIALLWKIFGDDLWARDFPALASFSSHEQHMLRGMLERKINTPLTSSAGRLFDAVASLIDLRQVCGFEGQAAMELEFLAAEAPAGKAYPVQFVAESGVDVIDWAPMVRAILRDRAEGVAASTIAANFHATLGEIIVEIAKREGQEQVLLSGGCFQNKRLTDLTIRRLREVGLRPYWHERVPPNDGGIALGQIVAAARVLRKES